MAGAALFVSVFGILALVPTGLGLYFLRPVRLFWAIFAIGALAVAGTGLVCAGALELVRHLPDAPGFLQLGSALGVMRVFGAPLLVLAFLLCSCLAPTRFSRWALAGATAVEGLTAAYAIVNWFIIPSLR